MRLTSLVFAFLGLAGATAVAAQDRAPATGAALWIRSSGGSLQDLTASSSGMPQFAVGHRGERFSIGVGFGWVRFRSTDEDSFGPGASNKDETHINLFQIGPQGSLDFWQSEDGSTRGAVSAMASVGRISITDKGEFKSPGFPSSSNETKTSGTLLGLRVGVGAEHFFDRHFAIGFETGIQGIFAVDLNEDGDSQRIGLGANGTYAVFRATVVF